MQQIVLVFKQGKLCITLTCGKLPLSNYRRNVLRNVFINDYFSFNRFVFGDSVIDDDDISMVNDENCVSHFVCLLQNQARFAFLAWAREKERK